MKVDLTLRPIKAMLLIVGLSLSSAIATADMTNCEVITKNSGPYNELISVANRWKDAVLNKDFETLASYAQPESRDYVRKALHDQNSDLYQVLYGKKAANEKKLQYMNRCTKCQS